MLKLKLTVAVLAFALAGTASAAGWRSLRVDASSEAAFEESLAAFSERLSASRRHVFGEALIDIWAQGTREAEADQREYSATDYYRQIDGLGYREIVTFTDPTGDTAKSRYRAAQARSFAARQAKRQGQFIARAPGLNQPAPPMGYQGQHVRGGSDAALQSGQAACGCAFPY